MNDQPSLSVPDHKTQELQKAFDVFNQVSQELTTAYETLQKRVESLTHELAIANGKLLRQYQEKEALSERLTLLLNALPAGVIVLDQHLKVSEVNPAACAMLGEALSPRAWKEVAEDALRATEAPDEWQAGDLRLSIQESPLDSAGGRILLLHDITSAQRLKNDLERNKRLAAMGEMAASLAHQLRTPLATALLYSANLTQPSISEEARTRFAEKASAQLQRLERLIQDVLLFARGESIGSDRIHCGQWLEEAAQTMMPLCKEKEVHFHTDATLDDTIIVGSKKALGGALLNLLENALHACEDHPTDSRKIELVGKVFEDEIKIAVRDTGKGMSAETKTRIFEPFFTTRGQGTGLGLAIALGVARAHGGNIEVSSTQGKGSEFVLSLPKRGGFQEEALEDF